MAGERGTIPPRQPGATGIQARDEIDRGLHGDKVDFPDPAVTPLGTDAEAGGAAAPAPGLTGRTDAVERPNDTNDSSPLPLFIFGGLTILIVATMVAVAL